MRVKRIEKVDKNCRRNKMFPVYEQKKENVHILQKTSRHAPPHLHNSVEFIYVISGSMEIGMGQELFHMDEGDFAVIFPDVIHHYQVFEKGKNKSIYVWALPVITSNYMDTLQNLCPVDPVIKKADLHPDIKYVLQALLQQKNISKEKKEEIQNTSENVLEERSVEQAYIQILLARSLGKMKLMDKKSVESNDIVYQAVSYIAKHLNMSGRKSFAEFEYTFVFDSHEVIYHYCKTDVNTLKMESLSIDGKEVIYYDFLSRDGFTLLEGSDTLNASIKNESPISRVKYVNNNSILTDTEENHVFKKFINFVDHMLLFYSLDSRGYEGFMNGSESIAEGIVNSGKVKDFENFMRENGIEYNIGISGWNKHHLFLSMSLTHFIILSFLSQCKKDLEKFQGYRYLLQRTIQI